MATGVLGGSPSLSAAVPNLLGTGDRGSCEKLAPGGLRWGQAAGRCRHRCGFARPPLPCCAAWFLTGQGPGPVHSPGFGFPALRDSYLGPVVVLWSRETETLSHGRLGCLRPPWPTRHHFESPATWLGCWAMAIPWDVCPVARHGDRLARCVCAQEKPVPPGPRDRQAGRRLRRGWPEGMGWCFW